MRDVRSSKRRRRLLGLAVLVVIIGTPGTAQAHAAIVSSQPEPGQELATAPGVVVLRFTEPLNVSLSRATVIDPTGERFEGEPTGEREIRVSLSTNAPGVYDVEWVTVSTLDLHTLRGSFRFGVGVSPGPGAEGEIGTSPQRSDLVVAIFRAVEYASLLLAIGMLFLRRTGRRSPTLDWVRPRLVLALGVALVSGLTVVVAEALTAAGSASLGAVVSLLTTGLAGVARTLRVLAEALAVLAALIGRGIIPFLLIAILGLSAAGHAAAVSWGIPVDALHLLAAGLWAGGVLALATLRPPGGWKGPSGRALLERFSRVAIPAFLFTVATGTLRGLQELSALRDLVATSYGQVLGLKVLGVLSMVPLSILASRRVFGSPRLEAGMAVLVIGAAALLAAYPLPPGRASEAEEAEEAPASTSALPEAGDLTLGGDAGQVLVGLMIRPAQPGPNQVLVYLLPLEGEDAAGGIPATLRLGGRAVQMDPCGTTCRRAEVDLQGGEELSVVVGTDVGGTVLFQLPDLPAPDGSEIVERVERRTHELRTYRLDEVLSSGLAKLRAFYAFEAPDRARISVPGGSTNIRIGDTQYLRKEPGGLWEVQHPPPLRVPSFIWDFFMPAVAPRIIGSDTVDGVRTQVVSFSGTGSLPIWFRLWVDDQGLVHRAEMRAQGHFMDHRYFAFDAPIDIEPPGGA
ncbi:MAG: copper resistance protein CopC [Actinomycetota bacterium]